MNGAKLSMRSKEVHDFGDRLFALAVEAHQLCTEDDYLDDTTIANVAFCAEDARKAVRDLVLVLGIIEKEAANDSA